MNRRIARYVLGGLSHGGHGWRWSIIWNNSGLSVESRHVVTSTKWDCGPPTGRSERNLGRQPGGFSSASCGILRTEMGANAFE
jgi:hypothetical protein